MKSWDQVKKNLLEDDSFRHELAAKAGTDQMLLLKKTHIKVV